MKVSWENHFLIGNWTAVVGAILLLAVSTSGLIMIKNLHPKAVPFDEAANWEKTTNVLGEFSARTCPGISFLDVLLDRETSVPADYLPLDLVTVDGQKLRSEAANQFLLLREEAQKNGFSFVIYSGFRSFADQAKLYQQMGNRAAPPGHSEHQLGTAVDLVIPPGSNIYPSKIWQWLDQNAHKFGFVMSYRGTQQRQTSYEFEPWHWRFVGVELATKIRYSTNTPQSFFRKISCL